MDVMFMAETWHDPESISISKLQSRGLVVFEKARPRLPDSVSTLLTNHGGVAVAFNSMLRRILLKLTSTASFEHVCENKLKLQVSHRIGCLSHRCCFFIVLQGL